MRKYKNGMSATCFTKRQVGLIYRAAKDGNVKIPMWVMTAMYDMAEFYGYSNKTIEEAESLVEMAIEEAANREWSWLQEHVDEFAEMYPQTGLKKTSKDARFIHGTKSPWNTDVLEDLKDDD